MNMYINDIGSNAGIIWHMLYEKKIMTIKEIGEQTHLKATAISLALGWLAKEDKINFSKMNGEYKISLKEDLSNFYY